MPIIAPERALERDGDFVWLPSAVGDAFRQAYHDLADVLRRGEVQRVLVLSGMPASGKSTWASGHDAPDVAIWDACCLTKAARQAVLTSIRAVSPAIPVDLVRLETPVEACFVRNAARTGRRRLPDAAMHRASRNYQAFPPSTAEGFARILRPDPGGHIAARPSHPA